MRKLYFVSLMRLLLSLTVFITATVNAQLSFDAGTTWVSDSSTQVVLDSIGLRYNASPIVLGNAFHFTGSNNVHITGSTVPAFSKLFINKNSSQLILDTDINVSSKVSFKTGLFYLNNHMVNLSPAATIENEQEASRFTDTAGGSINISINVSEPSSINPGNLGVVFSSVNYSGSLAIVRGHQPQAVTGSNANSIARYYTIYTDDKGGINATLRLNYFDAEKRGLDENKFVVWQQNNAGVWKNAGTANHDATLNWVEQKGFNGFGTFTLAAPDSVQSVPLPTLTLSGEWKFNVASLTWTTVSENNNDHFDIERKYTTDTGFIKINVVASKYADGNSITPTIYQYIDAAVNTSNHDIQYRIKQITKDGRIVYSNTITLNPVTTTAADGFIVKIYPTIAAGASIYIQVGNAAATTMQVKIFDMYGKQVLSQTLGYSSQSLMLPFLSHGMYRMTIRSADLKYQRTFIK